MALSVPVSPSASAGSLCAPIEHPVLAEQSTPAGTFYVAQYRDGAFVATGVWQERNGIPGLQTTTDEACWGQADLLRAGACPNVNGRFPGLVILCVVEVD